MGHAPVVDEVGLSLVAETLDSGGFTYDADARISTMTGVLFIDDVAVIRYRDPQPD